MAVELATAYISLVPSLKGAGREIGKQLGAADVQGQVAKAGRTSGLTWARNAALGIGAAGLAGAGTVVGIALSKGFNRSIQLQEAEKKLEGLGHSAETVAQISDNALGAVRGTAFGMGEAMTAAANAVAAGVKPGQDLQRTLTLVGDAATIAGADFGEMGAIWNKVAASNKVQMDSINQLHDRGVPRPAVPRRRARRDCRGGREDGVGRQDRLRHVPGCDGGRPWWCGPEVGRDVPWCRR